jgi:hypothetical protein
MLAYHQALMLSIEINVETRYRGEHEPDLIPKQVALTRLRSRGSPCLNTL